MPANQKYAIGVSIAAAMVFLASFTPWGQIHIGTPQLQGMFGANSPFGQMPMQMPVPNMEMTISVNAWNGSIQPGGLSLPNWLVVLAAAAAAGASWLKATSLRDLPLGVPIALAIYGVLHAGFAVIAFAGSAAGSLGLGVVLTVVAFLAMLAVLLIQSRDPALGVRG